MCKVCSGVGVIYSNKAIGIEIKKCPACDVKSDPCAELRKRIEQAKKEFGIA